jgi:periplasmic copper chaperone A
MNTKLLGCLMALISLPTLAADRLVVSDAWAPQAPPRQMMAGFMTLHNPGDQDVVLVDATSPQFERIEIHTMAMDEGVMRMRRLPQLVIPAGETISLRSGGLHLMMIQPASHYQPGDELAISLIAEDGTRAELIAIVRPRHRSPAR